MEDLFPLFLTILSKRKAQRCYLPDKIVLPFLLAEIPARMIIISGLSPKRDILEHEDLIFQKAYLYLYRRNKQNGWNFLRTEEQSLESGGCP